MDLYKNLNPVRSEPIVWISRLVVFERVTPQPTIIRDIALTPGLNIVWAEEPEDDDSSAEISGHSAGKTTFCRFLRYVLGERTFSTKAGMELIRATFPDGYVAGEIHVSGKKWAVRRPIGSGRMSYLKENASVEELLQQSTGAVSQDDYLIKLGLDSLVNEMETGAIVRTRENIEWGHILAWCTRDQESRYQNIHEWRSPRSQSEAPGFQRPRESPLFVMRAAMGLFVPDELKGEEKLADLGRETEKLEKEIEEKRREPQFRVNLYDHELRQRLRVILPNEQGVNDQPLQTGELLSDLHRLTDQACSIMEKQSQEHEAAISGLQDEIDNIGGQVRERENELYQFNALFDINTAAGNELESSVSGGPEQLRRIKENQDKLCPFGNVLIKECSYVRNRQGTIRITQIQDVHAMEQAQAHRAEEQQKIERSRSDLHAAISDIRGQRTDLQAKRQTMEMQLREIRRETHELRQARSFLEAWTLRRDQGMGYEELVILKQRLESGNSQIVTLERELADHLQKHDENRDRLATIFSNAVRSVLSPDGYDGAVSLDKRELAFRITHGPAMGGEAVETLSVLLADIATLVYHTLSEKSRMLGFLLHDSPREADLGIRIYRSFIRLAASLQSRFESTEKIPFQYILTTTTPPPQELQTDKYLKLRLKATKPEELFLKRNVALPVIPDQIDLFKDEEMGGRI